MTHVVLPICLILALAVGTVPGLARTWSEKERKVKAALLYKFGKFIHWSEEKESMEAFHICVTGENPFAGELRRLEGKKVRGKALVVEQLTGIEPDRCHILFVGPSEDDRLTSILQGIGGTNVLTVGDTEGFARLGGMINLRVIEGRITLDINLEAAQEAGLQISARLLELGKIVSSKR
jgi:hypothetical protein